jgi:hypothetical protein
VADLRISELATLAGANLAAGDFLAVADVSASESRKITVTDFVGNAVTLIADATIPNAKILFSSATIPGAALQAGSVTSTQLAEDSVTALDLADNSSCRVVATLPATGQFIGQLALTTAADLGYIWDGSQWVEFKAAGSVNTIIGGSAGIVNVTVSQVGDTVTINTTLDNTTAAAQFLAGPTSGAGAVSYRAIAGADLPAATTTAKGAVVVNGNGLAMSGDTLTISNSVAAETTDYHIVQYDANGLITAGRQIGGGDLPVATALVPGVVTPGDGLAVNGAGEIGHSNAVISATGTKVTYDAQGHITASVALEAADIPDIPAEKLTTGNLSVDRLANNTVTGLKLANNSVTKIGGAAATDGIVTFPDPDYNGQYFYDSINGDLYLWDGNAWQAITITAGEIIFAGTFDASAGGGTGLIDTVTTAGSAIGLTAGSALPAASGTNLRYYVIVSTGGTITSGNAPNVTLAPPDMLLSDGTAWNEIDVSSTVAAQTALNISVSAIAGMTANNVQAGLEELNTAKMPKAGGTFTGDVTLDGVDAIFDTGSFNITLTGATATANRTITLPDGSGTLLLAGAGSIVNADINASAGIAFSKLATLTSGQIIVGNSSNAAAAVAMTGDVTITNAGVTSIAAGAVIDTDINASAAIAFSKLAPLTSAHLLVGNGSNVATSVAVTGDVTISNAGVTAIAAGAIVNADISGSAEIAVSKLADGAARQLLQTDAAGTGVEWASNIDVPGTLDVTGVATFDATVDLAKNVTQTVTAVAATAIDCSLGNYFTKTISSNTTFTFTNVPSSRAYSFTLELTHTSGTVTWPSEVKWPSDTAPTLATGKTHLFMFVTDDGGTRWRGAALIDYVN